ncbi:hypothetical protein D3C74_212520 [compost metagenome]
MNDELPVPVADDLSGLRDLIDELMGDYHLKVDQQIEYIGQTKDSLQSISGKLDLINHSLYVQNEYLSYTTVSIMLLAAIAIFMLGYLITRR